MDNKNYQLVVFCMGEVPKICYTEKNIIFFLYQPGFNKIYYCGKLFLKKEELTTTSHDFTNFEVLEIC
ncbi:MAG: hypothetical protein L3J09_04665 [Flavobacteriaceae bacterium]|nr:hypothetical protein [Flavobacteriaceae bacterium]